MRLNPSMRKGSFRRAGIVAAVVLVALTATGCSNADLKAEYLTEIKGAPGVNFADVPDEQLLFAFDDRCDLIDIFGSERAIRTNAREQWNPNLSDISKVTESEYVANRAAAFLAAKATCD